MLHRPSCFKAADLKHRKPPPQSHQADSGSSQTEGPNLAVRDILSKLAPQNSINHRDGSCRPPQFPRPECNCDRVRAVLIFPQCHASPTDTNTLLESPKESRPSRAGESRKPCPAQKQIVNSFPLFPQ